MWRTYAYVEISSYAVECPTPLSEPAVASDKCASNPLSEIPELRMRRSSTKRLDKKSEELWRWGTKMMGKIEAISAGVSGPTKLYATANMKENEKFQE